MILSGEEIKKYLDISLTQGIVDKGILTHPYPKYIGPNDKGISIHPYPKYIGPNSVDLTLSNKLLTIEPNVVDRNDDYTYREIFDTKVPPLTTEIIIPEEGFLLEPQSFYLGSTVERTKTLGFVPCIESRSTIARYGIITHLSAGFGDSGFGVSSEFGNSWTLEIFNVNKHPVKIYPGMKICQIYYMELKGNGPLYNGHYVNQEGPVPPRL